MLADRGIRSTFANAYQGAVEIHNEYLDISRFPEAAIKEDLAKFLGRKYAGRKIDLVIAGLASGLDYALKYRDEIFPDNPIVFMAVDRKEIRARTLPADVIGVPIQMDLAASLEVALRCPARHTAGLCRGGQGEIRQLLGGGGAAPSSAGMRTSWKSIYLAGLPMAELLEKVASLPDHSLIYYLHIFEDGDGKVYVPAEALELIAAKANAPIFSHVDSYIGRGVVGGRVFSFEAAGKQAAGIGVRMLAGEKPEAIGIQQPGDNAYMFDWRQLDAGASANPAFPPAALSASKSPGCGSGTDGRSGAIAVLRFSGTDDYGIDRARATVAAGRATLRQAVDAAPTGMLMMGQRRRSRSRQCANGKALRL